MKLVTTWISLPYHQLTDTYFTLSFEEVFNLSSCLKYILNKFLILCWHSFLHFKYCIPFFYVFINFFKKIYDFPKLLFSCMQCVIFLYLLLIFFPIFSFQQTYGSLFLSFVWLFFLFLSTPNVFFNVFWIF